jgi:REP element-mobilizing transposase RayT
MPQRKSPIHLPVREIGSGSAIVFMTVCTQERKPILARPDIHELLRFVWSQDGPWLVGRYVLMPDHIHLFCGHGVLDDWPLARWVKFWKSRVSQRWPRPKEQPIWQKSFWDTQLRRGERYDEKWEYVRQNPARRHLVAHPEDWPYQGEMHVLEWHD